MEKQDYCRIVAIVCFVGIAVMLFLFFAGYAAGTRAADQRHQLAVAQVRAEHAATEGIIRQQLADVTGELDQLKNGIDRIGAGLANAVDVAGRATDRAIRIAVLVDAIDRALRELGQHLGD